MSWLSKFIRKREKEVKKIIRELNLDDLSVSDLVELALKFLDKAGEKQGVPLLGQAVNRIIEEKLNDTP